MTMENRRPTAPAARRRAPFRTFHRWAKFVPMIARIAKQPGFALLVWIAVCPTASGQTLVLKDGRKLEGKYSELASVAENPLSPKTQAGEVPVTPLVVVDDGLRRTYVHTAQVAKILEPTSAKEVRINIWQPVAQRGNGVGRIGRALRVTPFDEFGRRIYEMQTAGGAVSVVQGITQITPVYTKIEGLGGGKQNIVWD